MLISKSFKTSNPSRADQKVTQELIVSDSLQYDYSKSTWIGLDTEFLSINRMQDDLCTIQISSEDPEDSEKVRVEILYVFKGEADEKLNKLMTDEKIEKIVHTFQADIPRIEEFIGATIQGDMYDVSIAAKIAITNLDGYSLENMIQYMVDPKFSKSKKITISEWDMDPEMWEEEQFEYAAGDVLYLKVLKDRIQDIADRRGRTKLITKTMKSLPLFNELLKNGFDHRIFS